MSTPEHLSAHGASRSISRVLHDLLALLTTLLAIANVVLALALLTP